MEEKTMMRTVKVAFLTTLIASLLFAAVTTIVFAEPTNTWDPNLGWDFQCHSHTHPKLSGLTAEEIRWEMEQVNAAFQSQGYAIPQHLAYPHGDFDDQVKTVVADYRLTGRMVWGFMIPHPQLDWFEVKAAQLKKSTSWNRQVGWIEDCIADNALLHIFTHDVSDTCSQYGCKPENLARLLDYLLDKQNAGLLEIVTMAEAYDYWSTATEGKPLVVVSFDDAYDTDYTTVYPMFQERGLKGTSYITTSFIGQPGYLTWAMIDEMRTGTSPPPKPDLTLTSNDISFSPQTPSEGEFVTLSAEIHNVGSEPATNVLIGFYDGAPTAENLIGTDTLASIAVGSSAVATTTWTAVSGLHDIYVVADPDDVISESNENNNEAMKTITVAGTPGVMHVSNIEISYSQQAVFYRAHAVVTIVDEGNAPVEGATVYGSWSGAYSEDVSGTTDANGAVTFTSGKVKYGGTFTFTITNVEKVNWTYDPAQNVETSDTITCP
jgi:peptidoglycan/xylan/chitin deacetylase (PgdA/CDA1 family)